MHGAGHEADRVFGVKALAEGMIVKLPGRSKRTDGDVAPSAESALRSTVLLPEDAVKIMVETGWVTLTGNVERQDQREALPSRCGTCRA